MCDIDVLPSAARLGVAFNPSHPGQSAEAGSRSRQWKLAAKAAFLVDSASKGVPAMRTDPKSEAQSLLERAQKARKAAEGTESASEQSRLNQHASDLEKQALKSEQQGTPEPPAA
ncbi:MAG: hypothetical protein JOY64_19585 [Alphaproteobacteria bacterium]|nr:hypothetical protein [Alphaproteobacteria bacterium]